MMTRRPILKMLAGSIAATSLRPAYAEPQADFPIGACDWSIGQKQNIRAFDVAAKIGLEGIQVSFSTPGSEFDLRDAKVREQYYKRADDTGIEIASLGMGVLNKMPLATHPEAIGWVGDVIDVLAKMRKERSADVPNVCLLAFFGKGSINGKPELMKAVIKKLKTVASRAEDNGVILGIESLLSADDHLKIIDGVGSKAIQVYYDSANSNKMGYDIYEEVVQIGGARICEVHCKENGALLGQGVVDFPRFKGALAKAKYKGWLIIEGALPKAKKKDLVGAYTENFKLLDRVFRSGKG